MDVEFRDGEVVLARSDHQKRPLGGRYAGSGIDSAALLLDRYAWGIYGQSGVNSQRIGRASRGNP